MHPLCITITEKEIGCNNSAAITFESKTSVIECIKGIETDRLALTVVDNIEAFGVIDMDIDHMITDCNEKLIEKKQLYKNKATFISLMAKNVIDHRFQFKDERSNK